MMKEMDMVFIHGPTVKFMQVNGWMASSMEKPDSQILREKVNVECGNTVRESSG